MDIVFSLIRTRQSMRAAGFDAHVFLDHRHDPAAMKALARNDTGAALARGHIPDGGSVARPVKPVNRFDRPAIVKTEKSGESGEFYKPERRKDDPLARECDYQTRVDVSKTTHVKPKAQYIWKSAEVKVYEIRSERPL